MGRRKPRLFVMTSLSVLILVSCVAQQSSNQPCEVRFGAILRAGKETSGTLGWTKNQDTHNKAITVDAAEVKNRKIS